MATRSDIRTRARIRADQDASTFPTDTQYNYLIDEAVKDVWFDLVGAGWPLNFSTANVTASTNPITLSVSGTLAFVRGVFQLDGGTYRELKRIPEDQRAALMSGSASGEATHYEVRIDPTLGPVIELLPAQTGGTYLVHYVSEHPGLPTDGTNWYGPARSDELIVLAAAAKGLRKEGDDQGADRLMMEYGRLWEKVLNMASWFDQRNAPVIRDVMTFSRRDPFDFDV
jgi:hypothetical protein